MKSVRSWIWLLLLVLIALGVARLRFDIEILNLLPQNLAVAQGLKLYQEHFSDARELILTLEAPTSEEAEAAAGTLAELLRAQPQAVTDVVWRPAWMEHPDQLTELVAFLWLNQPPAVFGELTNRLAVTNLNNVLQTAREQLATSLSPNELGTAGYDPYGLMRLPGAVASAGPTSTGEEFFASRDGTFRLLFVEAKPDLISYRSCRAWLAQIKGYIAEARAAGKLSASVRLGFTGRPAFVTEIAGGMEKDLAGSSGGTLATIGILFWLTHRRLRPLFWLLGLLVLILAGATALGGLFLGTVNVVSMGFASILLGLSEDFGIVIYQESRSHPELDVGALRRQVAPGICWSAVTTAGAFIILNMSVLPGLGQLGSLVAIGIILAAGLMLYGFLPPLLRMRRDTDREASETQAKERWLLFAPRALLPGPLVWTLTGLALLASLALLATRGMRFDHSPNVLKPRHSEANAALEQIKSRFERPQEPLWVLVPGRNETEVRHGLERVTQGLDQALSNRWIKSYTLPTQLWPDPENQRANRPAALELANRSDRLQAALGQSGFTSNSFLPSARILDAWKKASARQDVFWPTNRTSEWVLGKVRAQTTNGLLALGFIQPTTNAAATRQFAAAWPGAWQRDGGILSGWELLGTTVFDAVVLELPRVVGAIFILVLLSLWCAFRNLKEVALSLVTLGFSILCLLGTMSLLKWDWNILNLMALPLLLGMGVDFSIHIQLALRRCQGDLLAVRRSVGRALLLAGATTVAGFVSLTFSTNGGMASLGRVCAMGIALALVIAVYLLPVWWKLFMGGQAGASGAHPLSHGQ